MLFIEYITFFRVIITLTNFGELISENKIFVWSIRDIVGDKTARNSQIVSTMVTDDVTEHLPMIKQTKSKNANGMMQIAMQKCF